MKVEKRVEDAQQEAPVRPVFFLAALCQIATVEKYETIYG